MAKKGNAPEYDHHVVAVRLRLTGAGNLQHRLSGLDDVLQNTLVPLPMTATARIEPTRLANLQGQRIRYELWTDQLNETFLIRRIIIYAKPVAIEYPT